VDGKRTLDPLNPRTIVSGAGEGDASELVMPAHHIPEEVVVDARAPRGTLHVVQEPWATPKVTIYLPASYDPKHEYATLYTADGSAWIDYIKLPTILDNLISANAIEPIIAVLIDAAAECRPAFTEREPTAVVFRAVPQRPQEARPAPSRVDGSRHLRMGHSSWDGNDGQILQKHWGSCRGALRASGTQLRCVARGCR